MKAIADNPPLIEIGITDLTNRVRNIMADANKINNTKVKSALKNWMKILETQGSSLYNVIEWKDESVHILDNHFLFYMRWKKMNRVELISKGQKLLDIKDLQVLQKEYEQWIDDLRQSEDFGKTMERNSILLHISSNPYGVPEIELKNIRTE